MKKSVIEEIDKLQSQIIEMQESIDLLIDQSVAELAHPELTQPELICCSLNSSSPSLDHKLAIGADLPIDKLDLNDTLNDSRIIGRISDTLNDTLNDRPITDTLNDRPVDGINDTLNDKPVDGINEKQKDKVESRSIKETFSNSFEKFRNRTLSTPVFTSTPILQRSASISFSSDEVPVIGASLFIEIIHSAKRKFNLRPEAGIKYLIDHHYFQSNIPTAKEIASFLFRENPMLSKRQVGAYLGQKYILDSFISKPFHMEVLKEFVNEYNFTDMDFCSSIRLFLSMFRLPGEAQQIDRIMQLFANRYIDCNPNHSILLTPDAAYVLAFSMIMLNTDLHNPAVKRKMTLKLFIRNNLDVLMKYAGVQNDSSQKFSDYLQEIYTLIQSMPLHLNVSTSTGTLDDDLLNTNPFYFTFFNPDREGWLYKCGGRIKTWKKRYGILTGSCLYYFKKEAKCMGLDGGFLAAGEEESEEKKYQQAYKQDPSGIIPLENLIVEEYKPSTGDGPWNVKGYFFRLTPSEDMADKDNVIKAAKTTGKGRMVEGRHSSYLFCCETEDERTDWMNAIKAQLTRSPVYDLYARKRAEIKMM